MNRVQGVFKQQKERGGACVSGRFRVLVFGGDDDDEVDDDGDGNDDDEEG